VSGRVLLIAAACLAGCGGARTKVVSMAPSQGGTLTVAQAGEGVVVEKADLDGDGRVDVWTYIKEGPSKQKLRRTVDLNSDGKPDLTEFYGDDGSVVRSEVDVDFDGRVDIKRTYRNGKIESEELASRFDGIFDVRKYYEDGQLVLKQVDTKHSGKFDEFQYFVGNKLYRVGFDHDGDGKPEVFEENPAVE